MRGVLSVTQLNEYLKMLVDGDRVLSDVWIRAEVSNLSLPRSGHLYLTLKDAEGQLRAVMFRTYAARLPFRPEDGMKVLAHGRISIYGASGQYQLYIDELQPDGAGALAMQYEQLRRRLEAEGLFSEARKKPLPPMPMRIGVITSPSGAAVHDIRNVLGRRFPCAEMILFPSAVQGAEAPEQLIMGIEFFSNTDLCDVIIIGRGGGSIEDLWAFNNEYLARAIAACPIPVISAVGHESDFTICDFVADRRAPTPSAAAELAVPDRSELIAAFRGTETRLQSLLSARVEREKRYVDRISKSGVFQNPDKLFDRFHMRLLEKENAIDRVVNSNLNFKQSNLSAAAARLEALNPLAVLSRGYATVSKEKNTVTRASDISSGDHLEVRFSDGTVKVVAE